LENLVMRVGALALAGLIGIGGSTASAAASDTPLGVGWGPVYGIPPSKAAVFVPNIARLGAGFSRVTLYWSQLEPTQGAARWDDLEAYVGQLTSPDQGMLTLSTASPWATRSKTWVFPSSPAKDEKQYYAFVRRVVEHVRGRVRYFQADTEPSSPFFWAGTPEEFARQQRVFYRAVKDADPTAMVVLAGSDGLFDPTGTDPFPGQDADFAFLSKVVASMGGDFDIFDLHLYGNPYTIPARIEAVRALMRKTGPVRPIIASEYGGPGFFEFKANRRWSGSLIGPGASAVSVRQLRQNPAAPETARLFLNPDDPALAQQMLRLQSNDLIVRNLLALSSGVVKTAFFAAWHDAMDPDAPNTVLFGAMRLLDYDQGRFKQGRPIAASFARLAAALEGETAVSRVENADQTDVFAFRVDRKGRRPLLIAWRRPPQVGAPAVAAMVKIPWSASAKAVDALGERVGLTSDGHAISLMISDNPVLID
jgi:hypothetical protein